MRALIPLLFFISGCATSPATITAFSSDGCSLFPDGSINNKDLWCDCCIKHDLAYWQGGTREKREQADLALKQCVLEKTGNAKLAEIIYRGVEFGGHPVFPNWYRWGYGWPYGRGYKPLTGSEKEQIRLYLLKNPPIMQCPA